MRSLINIQMVLEEMRCDDVGCIHVRRQWRVPVNTKTETLISIRGGDFLHYVIDSQLPSRNLLLGISK
jgi:hypothetical protein